MNEGKIKKLKDELARAKEKAAEWQARVRDIERQITEQENMEILRAVRSVAATPEELRGLLERIRTVGTLEAPAEVPQETQSDGDRKEAPEWQG